MVNELLASSYCTVASPMLKASHSASCMYIPYSTVRMAKMMFAESIRSAKSPTETSAQNAYFVYQVMMHFAYCKYVRVQILLFNRGTNFKILHLHLQYMVGTIWYRQTKFKLLSWLIVVLIIIMLVITTQITLDTHLLGYLNVTYWNGFNGPFRNQLSNTKLHCQTDLWGR